MKRFICFLSVFFAVALNAFEAKVVITRALNIEDQFAHILPQRPPFFPMLSKVEKNAPFSVYFVCIKPELKDGKAKISGKITLHNADGTKKESVLPAAVFNVKGDKAGVLLLPQILKVRMEAPPADKYGKYTVALELKDENSGRKAVHQAEFEYVEKLEMDPKVKPLDKITEYYRNPQPQYLLAAFRELLKLQDKQKAKEKRAYNPLPQLSLFYFVLKHNPQYVDDFSDMVINDLKGSEQILGAVVLCALHPEKRKEFSEKLSKGLEKNFSNNPFEIDKAMVPWHLDILWSEFFVTGRRESVLKILKAAKLAENSLNINDFKKIKNPTKTDKQRLMNFLTSYAVYWSANSLIKKHELLRYYLECAFERKELTDKFSASLTAKILSEYANLKK